MRLNWGDLLVKLNEGLLVGDPQLHRWIGVILVEAKERRYSQKNIHKIL